MARLRWTVFVKFWGNRDPPELSRLLRGKANRPTKFWGHRDPLELSRFLFGTLLPAGRSSFGGSPSAQSYMIRPDLVDTRRWPAPATTQPPDPTLPSRAHHKDYVSRTTSSNYYQQMQTLVRPVAGSLPSEAHLLTTV